MTFYSSSSNNWSSNYTFSYNNGPSMIDRYNSLSSLRSIPSSYSYTNSVPVFYQSLKRPSLSNDNETKNNLDKKPLHNSSCTNINIQQEDSSDTFGKKLDNFKEKSKYSVSIDNLAKDESFTTITRNESNDLEASALSNIQLSLTDDLTTQVDYILNEVDNRMICSGRQVEIESFELSTKSGLISKCIYINELLTEANLNETHLDSDPIFTKNGKGILMFIDSKDAEDFSYKHSNKFTVKFNNNNLPIQENKNLKKNVTFVENNILLSNDDDFEIDKKPILKNKSKSFDSNFSNNSQNLNENILISANTSKKNKTEGYEILTIRAKLKQRIGQNRAKQVTLGDIDSIMRNVVTIIQDEFMKRFPSGPAVSVTNGENTVSRT